MYKLELLGRVSIRDYRTTSIDYQDEQQLRKHGFQTVVTMVTPHQILVTMVTSPSDSGYHGYIPIRTLKSELRQ